MILREQRAHSQLVAGRPCVLHLPEVQEAVRLPNERSADDHHHDRDHAQEEDEAPSEIAEQQIHPGRQEHPERPAALHERVQQPPVARGNLLVHDRDRDRELRHRKAGGQHAHDRELPEARDEVGHAGEDGGGGEAQHPHAPAPQAVHPVTGEQRDDELRRIHEEHQRADLRLRKLEVLRDVGDGQHQQIHVVGRERPPRQGDDGQVGGVLATRLGRADRFSRSHHR